MSITRTSSTYIDWKVTEEQKVAALVAGSKLCNTHLNAVMQACQLGSGDDRFDPKVNQPLKQAIRAARKAMIPENYVRRVIPVRAAGLREDRVPHLRHRLGFGSLSDGLGPELQQLRAGAERLHRGGGARRRLGSDPADDRRRGREAAGRPRALEPPLPRRAWACADPGVQFDTTINDWHTCPAGGRINASNPCFRVHVPRRHRLQSGVAEPHDLPAGGRQLRTWRRSATRSRSGPSCWKVSVLMAQFPSREIAERSYRYRTRWASATPTSADC